jgi:hypothetical protein
LHTGQQIQYLNWGDGKLRSARGACQIFCV